MKLLLYCAMASLFVAAPAMADKVDVPPPSRAGLVRQALSEYGQWLARLTAIEQPVLDALPQLGPKWQRAVDGHNAKQISAIFRPEMARIKQMIAEANQGLAAADTPDFASLSLPADIRSAALVRSFIDLNGRMGMLVDSYGPLMDAAARNDRGAVITAVHSMMNSAGLLLETQVVLVKARQVSIPPDNSAYEVTALQLVYYQSGARMLKGLTLRPAVRPDTVLARDLDALAAEAEAIATRGPEKLEREVARYRRQGDEARAGGESDRAALNDQLAALTIADRPAFALAKQLATLLRKQAALLRTQPSTLERMSQALRTLVPIREGLLQVARDENAAAAGVPRS